jgi:adenylate cyclase class IV
MREVELKSVVDDVPKRRALIEAAGAKLEFEGRLIDRRYGDDDGLLLLHDEVLRLRVYENSEGRTGHLDWKGGTTYENGYKVREEYSTSAGDPDTLATILGKLGYTVILEIDRRIAQYTLHGATVRFEEYPRMDPLVEVEGAPESIEKAIVTLGLERAGFTSDRLTDFVTRFEARTGAQALLSDAPA